MIPTSEMAKRVAYPQFELNMSDIPGVTNEGGIIFSPDSFL